MNKEEITRVEVEDAIDRKKSMPGITTRSTIGLEDFIRSIRKELWGKWGGQPRIHLAVALVERGKSEDDDPNWPDKWHVLQVCSTGTNDDGSQDLYHESLIPEEWYNEMSGAIKNHPGMEIIGLEARYERLEKYAETLERELEEAQAKLAMRSSA